MADSLQPDIIRRSGAGKGYQIVAQACAIAVQDGADYLRNVSTISTTAVGIATLNLVKTKDLSWVPVIAAAQNLVTQAAQNFEQIGTSSAAVLGKFTVS